MQCSAVHSDCTPLHTASNTLAVPQETARKIRPGTVFLDLNSAAPGTTQKAAALIEAAGGR